MALLFFCGLIYLFPTLVAISNKKTNAGAVAVLNIFLGWLLIPWVIALTWAVCKDKK
jgi:phosphotransferase system  glucose/maltose/N-acetylglucosamine-specific IIC component